MRRTLVGFGLLVAGVVLVGPVVFFGVTRLDEADKWGSVIAALVAVIGLPIAAYGLVSTRRRSGAVGGGQSVTGSFVGGGVTQVRGVRGDVRIGKAAPPVPAAGPPGAASGRPPRSGAAEPGETGGQSVTGSSVAGELRQADDVGGDVDIER